MVYEKNCNKDYNSRTSFYILHTVNLYTDKFFTWWTTWKNTYMVEYMIEYTVEYIMEYMVKYIYIYEGNIYRSIEGRVYI